ncbi:response regulator [Bradyrhizobium sp. WSM 1738]|uniref:response regulator n=1 Tax=Bradyrhizobium hereditatis TaxID=2821405 RepID=UPI001CE30FA7|nr:response regulator [Bradyrhizobium hereditatis]MCA6118136.1 response regulator [Bradyrhizobium hereditatis]
MVDNFVKVVEALSKLGSALAWPLVALTVLWWFRTSLREFITNMSEGSVKLFGLEAFAKRKAIEAVATAEVAKIEASDGPTPRSMIWLQSVGKSRRLADWLAHVSLNDLAGRKVLWVDDNPDNNVFETEALQALGIEVEFVTTTSEAMRKLQKNDYDVVISDMTRFEDEKAGYSLLNRLRDFRPGTPFILYSSTNTPDQERAIVSQGAYGSTSRASELVELVVSAIREEISGTSRHSRAVRDMMALRNRRAG